MSRSCYSFRLTFVVCPTVHSVPEAGRPFNKTADGIKPMARLHLGRVTRGDCGNCDSGQSFVTCPGSGEIQSLTHQMHQQQ